jgi:hypothetical protein
MATFAISISFTVTAKDHEKAYSLAERIGEYVVQENMASDQTLIDVELLEDEEADEDLDFGDDE